MVDFASMQETLVYAVPLLEGRLAMQRHKALQMTVEYTVVLCWLHPKIYSFIKNKLTIATSETPQQPSNEPREKRRSLSFKLHPSGF